MYSLLFVGTLCANFVSTICFIIWGTNKKNKTSKVALFSAVLSLVLLSCALIARAFLCGFPPMSNLYESLVLFVWTIVFIFLVLEYRYKFRIIGVFVMPLAFLILFYAALLDNTVKPLIPALQSWWLVIHVLSCFFGYACFACAFCLGIMFLLQERQVKTKHTGKIFERFPSLGVMDKINYDMVKIGFVFLTLGIITGSIWAQHAWGNWWSWDPKETWSLITWLVYAAYLHARFNSGWQGRKMAILSIAGFMVVLFTYLGVSFLLPGLHSYL
ncbi:MAG: c-type cytochrome biogenesis protein CcsB [Candidatus Omnitrophica bacterium]|nr:c-type cytochrome biogenesis protein CcsB [Candidatus Omnitrophota bacterium]